MSTAPLSRPNEPEYAWELAKLYPAQGAWSEEEYLNLTDSEHRRIEFADGRLEFLPMPTLVHQLLGRFLFLVLFQFVDRSHLGDVHFSGIRVRIRRDKIREPDIIFVGKDHFHARHNRVWDGADLVMEVVSDDPKDRVRDFDTKSADYAEAKIAEYWIVDYDRRRVIVHRLDGNKYVVHGEFAPGQQATSVLLSGFAIDVMALFDAAKDVPE